MGSRDAAVERAGSLASWRSQHQCHPLDTRRGQTAWPCDQCSELCPRSLGLCTFQAGGIVAVGTVKHNESPHLALGTYTGAFWGQLMPALCGMAGDLNLILFVAGREDCAHVCVPSGVTRAAGAVQRAVVSGTAWTWSPQGIPGLSMGPRAQGLMQAGCGCWVELTSVR